MCVQDVVQPNVCTTSTHHRPTPHSPHPTPPTKIQITLQEPDNNTLAAALHTARASQQHPRESTYRLSALVLHWGTSPSNGHYTCITQARGSGPWCTFNDTHVTALANEAMVLKEENLANDYMVFYELDALHGACGGGYVG